MLKFSLNNCLYKKTINVIFYQNFFSQYLHHTICSIEKYAQYTCVLTCGDHMRQTTNLLWSNKVNSWTDYNTEYAQWINTIFMTATHWLPSIMDWSFYSLLLMIQLHWYSSTVTSIRTVLLAYNRELVIVCVVTMECPRCLLCMIMCVSIATAAVWNDQYGRVIITHCTGGKLPSQW